MATDQALQDIPRHGRPAPITRSFGWAMLGVLAAFLINNAFVVWGGYPGLRGLGANPSAWLSVALFAVGIVAGIGFVVSSPNRSLRWDAHLVHAFNTYLIRGLFWTVFLTGIIDAGIAFLRVESLAEPLFGADIAGALARPGWVGLWIHVPLIVLGFVIAAFTRTLGFAWLSLLIVAAELLIVISRFIFSYEQALMGDLVRYWYAALFLFASAYSLYDEAHVRVDILYAGLVRTTRGKLNAIGTILFGMTSVWVILLIGFNGRQSIINAPVVSFEISQSGPFGMFVKYQMAAFIGIFAITMLIEFVSYLFNAVADARGEPGHRTPAETSAH